MRDRNISRADYLEAKWLTPLQEKLAALDLALTGCPWKDVLHTAWNADATWESVVKDQYYLSDAGYSRIACNDETGKIWLTSNSRAEVKVMWESCPDQIAAVQGALLYEIVSNEGE